MTDIPRGLPKTQAERAKVIARRTPGGDDGSSRNWKPVANRNTGPGRTQQAQSDNVITGTQDDDTGISITSTTAGDGSSNAAGFATAVGNGATATDYNAVAIGYVATAIGVNAAAIGPTADAEGEQALALGSATANGYNTTAIQGLASADGAVAIGADSSGTTAHATNIDDFALGTDQHAVMVRGKFLLDDGTGTLWQLSVSTGGVLSVVAYP